ncbi:MAG: hypothetical protein WBE18_05245 [Gammaproteobacteria bacterium]
MHNLNKTKLGLIFLGVLIFNTHAAAYYSSGPYLNLGAGGILLTTSGTSAGGGAGRLGLGYLGVLTDEENPFLLGFELNGDFGYTGRTSSLYGADFAAILARQFTEQAAIFGKLGMNAIGQNSIYFAGPQIGLGIGYQMIPSLRLIGEGNYALDPIRIGNARSLGSTTVNVFNLLIGLQYTFYITNYVDNDP